MRTRRQWNLRLAIRCWNFKLKNSANQYRGATIKKRSEIWSLSQSNSIFVSSSLDSLKVSRGSFRFVLLRCEIEKFKLFIENNFSFSSICQRVSEAAKPNTHSSVKRTRIQSVSITSFPWYRRSSEEIIEILCREASQCQWESFIVPRNSFPVHHCALALLCRRHRGVRINLISKSFSFAFVGRRDELCYQSHDVWRWPFDKSIVESALVMWESQSHWEFHHTSCKFK